MDLVLNEERRFSQEKQEDSGCDQYGKGTAKETETPREVKSPPFRKCQTY